MSSQQLDEEAIFHVARKLDDVADREQYLNHICAGDLQLRDRVEALLKVHEQQQGFLKSTSPAATIDQTPLTEDAGTAIGRYKLREKLGEGGFGVVWAAEQQQPVRRKVALKVIKPGMDSRDVVARFEAERQALALMDHPNIARVIDGGATEHGRPFFVMELIRGVPITEYCDQSRLTIAERLRLFLDVCKAVQHAHQKGIIHRDIKPSNVLVTVCDNAPVPKVIDFGVAKAVSQQLTDKTIYTRVHAAVGTLSYMAPEQAALSGQDIDTRADVYGLGVLLYELLTGTTPLDPKRLERAALDEAIRLVREEEAPRASTRLSSLGETATIVSSNRSTDPDGLRKLIRGELDWILLKALQKDRGQRYESASSLSNDVQRLLNHDPVEACPPTTLYRLHKFVRRNKTPVATAIAMTVLLLAGLAATSVGLWYYREAQRDVERQAHNLRINLAFKAWEQFDMERLRDLLWECLPDFTRSDDFQWRLLWEQLRRHQAVELEDYHTRATCIAVAPKNGAFSEKESIAIGLVDGRVVVRDLHRSVNRWFDIRTHDQRSWKSTRTLKILPNAILAVGGVLSDGTGAIAVGPVDGDLLEVQDWAYETPINEIAVSVDGSNLFVVCDDGRIEAREIEPGKQKWSAQHPLGSLADGDREDYSVDIAVNDRCVVSLAAKDNTLCVWDASSGEEISQRRIEGLSARDVAFSNDGQLLAVSHTVGIDIFQIVDRVVRFTHRIPVRSNLICFSPDDAELAATGSFGGIRFFDVRTSREVDRFVHRRGVATVKAMAYTADGGLIAAGAFGSIKEWSLRATRPSTIRIGTNESAFAHVAQSPDKSRVAAADVGKKGVKVWNPESGKLSYLEAVGVTDVHGIAFSHDNHIAAGTDEGLYIWKIGSRYQPESLLDGVEVWSVAFSADGQWLAMSPREGGVKLWNRQTRQWIELDGSTPGSTFLSLKFSLDNRYLIAGGGRWNYYADSIQGETHVWDMNHLSQTTQPFHSMSHEQMVYSVDISPDERHVAAGGLDAAVQVLDLSSWKSRFFGKKSWWVTGLAFTPDGSQIVTASPTGDVTFWENGTFEELGTFRVHEHVRRIAFTKNGLITASSEGHLRFWNATPIERCPTRASTDLRDTDRGAMP